MPEDKGGVQQEVRALVRKEAHVWRNAAIITLLWVIGAGVVHWLS